MPGLKQQLKLANWTLVLLAKNTIQVHIVQILTASSQEFHTITHAELMWVCHQVKGLLSCKCREEERIKWLLRQVSIGEILSSRHYIYVDIFKEMAEPVLKAFICISNVRVYPDKILKISFELI